MRRLFASLVKRLETDVAVAMVTVVGARGSTPREAGARMLVTPSGDIMGTIGGGRLELEAIDEARAMLAGGKAAFRTRAFALGPSLGQCCGGHVTLAIETFTRSRKTLLQSLSIAETGGGLATVATIEGSKPLRRRILSERSLEPAAAWIDDDGQLREIFPPEPRFVYVFGAGHVGRALMLALAPLPFTIVWIDERPEMFPSAVPANVNCVVEPKPARVFRKMPRGAMVLIMTHDHAIDLDILHAALKSDGLGYIGLIGSATKRARFESRLKDLGIDSKKLREVRCPIGVPGIRSKEPAMIAAAVAAELLIEDERLRAAGGYPVQPPASFFGWPLVGEEREHHGF